MFALPFSQGAMGALLVAEEARAQRVQRSAETSLIYQTKFRGVPQTETGGQNKNDLQISLEVLMLALPIFTARATIHCR